MTSVFLAPHNDDETLFGAFTLLQHKPHVIVCYDPHDPIREDETGAACAVLGCRYEQWRGTLGALKRDLSGRFDRVFAPAVELDGQPQHNNVGCIADELGCPVVHYMTYTTHGKSTGTPVEYELPWIGLKLRALGCYPSQYAHPSYAPHFVRGLEEFYQ